jgi:Protein of unknown function (DUF2950)
MEDEMQSVINAKAQHGRAYRFFPLAIFIALMIPANSGRLTAQATQNTYNSPNEAVAALFSAVKSDDANQLMRILGPEANEIIRSGDDVADKQTREKFLQEYNEMNRLVAERNNSETLYLGAENWPFPIPLVKQNGAWRFDSAAGKKEILYRRIGRNEFATVDTLHALVDAEKEYASEPRDGNTKQYAQKLMSDEGKHNGLYWKSAEGEPASPIGPLIVEAFNEGYRKKDGPVPFHGYTYRLLLSQGANAPGGAKNYLVNGKLAGGFAFIAYPVEYRNSGVMTFIVNQDGKVYQKDLGPKTEEVASAITAYDPDKTWEFVE